MLEIEKDAIFNRRNILHVSRIKITADEELGQKIDFFHSLSSLGPAVMGVDGCRYAAFSYQPMET